MSKFTRLCLAFLVAFASGAALAAGNAELGKAKSVFCVVCHGADGKNALPMLSGGTAQLAGMDQQKFIAAMQAYRNGKRFHPVMQVLVFPLGEQDIEDFAAYYASLGAK
jgi:cytochrome c553